MLLEHYNLLEQPFGVTPDLRYLYSSPTHREALASLLYGLKAGRGFVALIAPPGMGKTTLLFQALTCLKERATVVFVFQTICTPLEFLQAVLTDLGVQKTSGSLIDLQLELNETVTELSRSGRPLVIVVDEAQNLDDSVLELVRMLSNFETSQEKLLQVVLSGQPQLAEKLASPRLVQLRQRISIVAGLQPFSLEETVLYIEHRLHVAGYKAGASLFSRHALAMIAERSEGVPRNINNLCFNSLSLGCALKQRTIEDDIVREVIADLELTSLQERTSLASRRWEDSAPLVPAFASVVDGPSMLRGWIPKFIGACAILFVLSWILFRSHRRPIPRADLQRNIAIPPSVAVPPSSARVAGLEQAREKTVRVGIIRVAPGQSFYRICVENFGTCSPGHLQQIRALNPWLINLDHIESGQNIRVPIVKELPIAMERDIAAPQTAFVMERGKQ